MNFGKLGMSLGVHYFGYLSGMSADSKSMFLLTRVKGEAEDSLAALGYPHLALYRPGFLVNRDNDWRLIETIGKYMPFVPKIEARDLGLVILTNAIEVSLAKIPGEKRVERISNKQLRAMAEART